MQMTEHYNAKTEHHDAKDRALRPKDRVLQGKGQNIKREQHCDVMPCAREYHNAMQKRLHHNTKKSIAMQKTEHCRFVVKKIV